MTVRVLPSSLLHSSSNPPSPSPRKILLVDSGIGGLTVLARLLQGDGYGLEEGQAYRGIEAHYVADTAWFPYGERSQETLKPRVVALLEHLVETLHPDLIVIACNTLVSVTASDFLPKLQQYYQVWDPIHAVCDTLVWQCHTQFKQGLTPSSATPTAILATPLTARSGVYPRLLHDALLKHHLSPDWVKTCHPVGCPGLASWIETHYYQAFQHGMLPPHAPKKGMQHTALNQVLQEPFDALSRLWQPSKAPRGKPHASFQWVLGCTHYPLSSMLLQTAWQAFKKERVSLALPPLVGCMDPADTLVSPVADKEKGHDRHDTLDPMSGMDVTHARYQLHFRFTASPHATHQQIHYLETTLTAFYRWVLCQYLQQGSLSHETGVSVESMMETTGEAWLF